MSSNFDFLINLLQEDEFDEKPVEVETFVTSPQFLGLPPLSEYQYLIVRKGTQIYHQDTIDRLYEDDHEAGLKRWLDSNNEVIMQLGKGSGKDYVSTIICSYVVYLLLCLKDPARYYGKPPDDNIDILNIAINSTQASNVFFSGLEKRITKSPWFKGKYEADSDGGPRKANEFTFQKNIHVYSGHSEKEAWEGYNLILVILDEIAGFAVDNLTGNSRAKTGDEVYKMYKASVESRFHDEGKVLLLSFPRFRGDFIQKRYEEVIAEKTVIQKKHKYKIMDNLPDNVNGNEFWIEWEEDHIKSYSEPDVFALRRPSWDVNPTKKIADYKKSFLRDRTDSLSRFACMPPDAVDAFFKNSEQVKESFVKINPIDDDDRLFENFQPETNVNYYLHVDLAQKHDRCAIAMSHVSDWVNMKAIAGDAYYAPLVVVDMIKWWTPTSDKTVDFAEVKEFIISLRRRGFHIELVTFDRWGSTDIMQQLEQAGMDTDTVSVAKKHYDDMKMVISEHRLIGPYVDILISELLRLQIIKDKVDHPRSGSKDLADAVCGAIFNAISSEAPDMDKEIQIHDYGSFMREYGAEERAEEQKKRERDGVIVAPSRDMPDEIESFLQLLESQVLGNKHAQPREGSINVIHAPSRDRDLTDPD